MGRRSLKFLGSDKWRMRDVRVERLGPAVTKVTDLVSHISITGYVGQSTEMLLRDLAHRVHQLE